MKAMVLKGVSSFTENPAPLAAEELPEPVPGEGEILIAVCACGVCHTELDEIEGRTPPHAFPVILGHQVVGKVAARGKKAERFQPGDRVGVGWIHWVCGVCAACRTGNENPANGSAPRAATPWRLCGVMTVPEAFAYPIPEIFTDTEAAPLLCAGAIGYRSLRLANLQDGQNLGLPGSAPRPTSSSRWSATAILT